MHSTLQGVVCIAANTPVHALAICQHQIQGAARTVTMVATPPGGALPNDHRPPCYTRAGAPSFELTEPPSARWRHLQGRGRTLRLLKWLDDLRR